jgi:putative flippase GtrA
VPGPTTTARPLAHLRRWARSRQLAFLVVGGINTLVGLGAFAVFERALGDEIGYLGALVLAYGVGIAVGFVLHRRFVFKVEGNVLVDLVRYVGVQAVAFSLNAVALPVLVEVVGVPVLPAQVLSLGFVLVTTYFGHALISFRRPNGAASAERLAGRDDHRRPEGQIAAGQQPVVEPTQPGEQSVDRGRGLR